jgi:NAD+ synthase (glutamine-hydrolysing)
VTICEDIWQHSEILRYTSYKRDPIHELSLQHPEIALNLSASPFSVGKGMSRLAVCSKAAATLKCPLLLCNQVGGNDSLIFDGSSLYVDAKGSLLDCAKAFEEDFLLVDLSQTMAKKTIVGNPAEEIYHALVLGLRDYFHKSGFKKACLGLSGGVDSALVACLAVEALRKENVFGVMMPSRYSSEGSISDSLQLAKELGIETIELPIEGPFKSYLDLLNPAFEDKASDVTEENIQARIRGMILMALSNKLGYIVLSTGNKSELAMGYSTLYGDMCGGVAVISDLTKQQVYAVSQWINRNKEIIPWNTIKKPPSAELRVDQKDSDSLPDYAIVDNVLQAYIEEHQSPSNIAQRFGYSLDIVEDLVRRIHRNEYKRRQSPPGLRISEKAFSVGRRFPIVQKYIK